MNPSWLGPTDTTWKRSSLGLCQCFCDESHVTHFLNFPKANSHEFRMAAQIFQGDDFHSMVAEIFTVFYSESMFGRVSSNIWSLHTFAILWGPLPKHASNVPKLLPSFGSLGHIVLWQEWFQRAHYTQHWSTTRTDHTLNMPTPVANVWAPCHSDEPGPLAAMHWRLTRKPLRFGPVSV